MVTSVKAFTLIEIMVVVVLLGILAAIVVPQMTGASNEAREAALLTDLRMVRTQIELYKLQHEGMYPGYVVSGGTISEWSGTQFVLQMAGTTDKTGDLNGTGSGPYLERFPLNPYVASPSAAASVKEGSPDGVGAGWVFDPDANKFHANDRNTEHQQY